MNYTISFTEENIYCPICEDMGIRRSATKNELLNYLQQQYFDFKGLKSRKGVFHDAMKEVRRWEQEGSIPCCYCEEHEDFWRVRT